MDGDGKKSARFANTNTLPYNISGDLCDLVGRGLGSGQGEDEEILPLLGVAYVDQLPLHH